MQQERLPGWFKQRDNNWLTAWAYVFCTTLLRLPFSLIDASMWAVLVYFCTGLAPEAGRYSPSFACSPPLRLPLLAGRFLIGAQSPSNLESARESVSLATHSHLWTAVEQQSPSSGSSHLRSQHIHRCRFQRKFNILRIGENPEGKSSLLLRRLATVSYMPYTC